MTRKVAQSAEFRKARRAAFARDDHACVKCGSSEDLHAHHIQPRDQDGSDEVDNLMTLCGGCHLEWELFVAGNTDLDAWLNLLPLRNILNFILHAELWRDDIPASAIRKLFSADVEGLSEGISAVTNAVKDTLASSLSVEVTHN